MTQLAPVEQGLGVAIDQEAILRHLGLDPRKPETQALVLACQRYGLDPLLKHMVLIKDKPYITRDGLLHVAHMSGHFDGIEVVDQGDDGDYYTAKVAVYRNDMGRPITYPGRYPKNGDNKKYGPEMALKVAEVMALRRAFDVTGIGAYEEQWDLANEPQQPARRPQQQRPALAPALAQDDVVDAELVATNEDGEPLATAKQQRKFFATYNGIRDEADRPAWILEHTGGRTSSWTEVTESEAADLITAITDEARNQTPGAF